mmetsp:Transcript_24948/g.39454  ORF Transcript_24948/g.39454 Transcript_24948/m.39454 type:complete len:110 (-) Transcript_24948:193-522(-)
MESFSIGDIKGTTGRFTPTSQLNHRVLLDVEQDGQKKKPFFIRRNKSFMQRKTDQQLLYQVYKAVDEKSGWGTLRKKCVKGRLFVNDEVVRLDRGENSLQATWGESPWR